MLQALSPYEGSYSLLAPYPASYLMRTSFTRKFHQQPQSHPAFSVLSQALSHHPLELRVHDAGENRLMISFFSVEATTFRINVIKEML